MVLAIDTSFDLGRAFAAKFRYPPLAFSTDWVLAIGREFGAHELSPRREFVVRRAAPPPFRLSPSATYNGGVETIRCPWATSERSVRYHDLEWGAPVRDDRRLFEFLILEGAQAGLSWETILNKRERYREVFDGFDPERVSRYRQAKIERLLGDAGIVRNRLKIASAVQNAKAFLEVAKEFHGFHVYLWRFVDGSTIQNRWTSVKQVPVRTEVSDALSKDLRKRGFNFVGSTICYAFMQAVGLVNDHLVACHRHAILSGKR